MTLQSVELRIGTRGSPLALVQARLTRRLLAAAHELPEEAIEIVEIRTTGDRITDRPLLEVGGKGLFTKEIDEALLDGRIDLAVHSAKDLETRLADGTSIAACLEREDVRDAFLSPKANSLEALPAGATVGTSSLRRQALVLHNRPDLKVASLRGNVETRLRKLDDGEADATLLAGAGLTRLGMLDRATALIPVDSWLPAVGQGVIAITARSDDHATREKLARIDHPPSATALHCERAFLAELDGSCRTPIGGLARLDGDRIDFRGIILRPDGSEAHEAVRTGRVAEAAELGRDAGRELFALGGAAFFATG